MAPVGLLNKEEYFVPHGTSQELMVTKPSRSLRKKVEATKTKLQMTNKGLKFAPIGKPRLMSPTTKVRVYGKARFRMMKTLRKS